MRHVLEAARRRPLALLLALTAVASAAWVIVFPFTQTRLAPMTDLPFHAAQTGIFRHYLDPSFHFAEQFELHPIAVPYMSSYALGAIFMLFVPATVAVKMAAAVMLSFLPAGLAVFFHGMKKSPLLGLAGLPFVWCHLTHWGFLNFVGAIGLFAASIGLTLLVLDKPTARRRAALASTLVLLFFTHIFRVPFGLAGVVATAVVMYPATRRFRPILLPLVPAAALFAAWIVARPATVGGSIDVSHFDSKRLAELVPLITEGGFQDPAEAAAIRSSYWHVGLVAIACLLAFVAEGRLAGHSRFSGRSRRAYAWGVGTTLVALGCSGISLLLFFVLPMQSGLWWYIYPREAIAAGFIALGLLPDLPRARLLRAPLVLALALGPLGTVRAVAASYRAFDRTTDDFLKITRAIPQAPKLMYLVFDHGGSTKKNTPFIHLPAYVQAEKGGWLSFHFVGFGASPIVYRAKEQAGAVVPPPFPSRWEWTPQLFRVKEQGTFFDWFLVRSRTSPAAIFQADPTIVPVEHTGTWWLYRRDRAAR